MQSRRNFIGNLATGLAGTPGDRGTQILRQAIGCENVECIGAADIKEEVV